jgi:hypothetical protein
MKPVFTTKRMLVILCIYLVAWALTAAIGCPQARHYVLSESGVGPSVAEIPFGIPHQCCAPQFSFRAVSYAPLFVTATFDYTEGEDGHGGTVIFLWAGVLGPGLPYRAWVI